jgi:hypothetical protein
MLAPSHHPTAALAALQKVQGGQVQEHELP